MALQAALSELRAGLLARGEPRGLDRLGPPAVMVARDVDLPASRAADRAAAFLRRQWFTAVRDQGGTSLWRPKGGLLADLRREFDFANTLKLAGVSLIALTVVPVPQQDGRAPTARLQLVAQLGDHRRQLATRRVLPWPIVGATAGLVAALLGAPEAALVIVPVSAAVGGGGWVLARRRYLERMAGVREALDGMVDRVAG